MVNAAVAAVASAPLEDGRFIRIRGEDVWVGELSLNQLVALLHFGRQLVQYIDAATLVTLVQQGQAAGANGQIAFSAEQIQTLINVGMQVLTLDQVNALVGIVLNRPIDWVAEPVDGRPRITTSVLGQVIAAVTTYNDSREVLEVFRKACRAILTRLSTDNSSAQLSA